MQNELEKQVNFLVYSTPEQDIKVNAVLKDESIWLTQKAMAELFDCSTDNISLHLKNIYESNELLEKSTTEEFSVVQIEGSRSVNRKTKFYNLDAIISVGYRVNSAKATKFRIWATSVLKEFMQKGFVLDDERLKSGFLKKVLIKKPNLNTIFLRRGKPSPRAHCVGRYPFCGPQAPARNAR